MKKETKIFILIIVISVALLTALDIQTKGKITSLIGSVNPLNLKSSDVPYTNNGQSTVQGAIDDLYNGYQKKEIYINEMCPGCVYRKDTTKKYNVNSGSSYKTDENTRLLPSEYTTDYATLNSNHFLGHVIDENGYILSSYACGINNGIFFCLKGVDSSQTSLTYKPFYQEAVNRVNKAIPECNASTSDSYTGCSYEVAVTINSNGIVNVRESGMACIVQFNGESKCT